MSIVFVSHADRPELVDEEELWREWPEFMLQEDTAAGRFGQLYDRHPCFQLWGLDAGSGELVVKVNCAPAALDPDHLPDDGWREALRTAVDDDLEPSLVCALQIQVARARRGAGLSGLALDEMRRMAIEHGFRELVAPVRPSMKALYPLLPADSYATWVRDDGLPFDPWLRVHARAGAAFAGVCHRSFQASGTVAEWENWASMAFPVSGDYVVPEALVPVTIDREADRGVYLEPNVWMHHRLQETMPA
jgi:hypothetical protein